MRRQVLLICFFLLAIAILARVAYTLCSVLDIAAGAALVAVAFALTGDDEDGE